MARIITALVTLAGVALLINQCRKPRWWPGRYVIWSMNRRHASVTRWGLGHVVIDKHFTILDVGCGGGMAVQHMASIATAGQVVGVDYSATSVATARERNAAAIAAGRVQVDQASVSHLPFSDATFDLVTAVETHYYWPAPAADLREIRRVLKPGGQLVLIAETYKDSRFAWLLALPMLLLRARYLTLDEHRRLLVEAGYVHVVVHDHRAHGWMCAVGQQPNA